MFFDEKSYYLKKTIGKGRKDKYKSIYYSLCQQYANRPFEKMVL